MRFRCDVWLDTHLAASGVCWKIGFLMLEDCSSFRCSLFTVGNCAVNGLALEQPSQSNCANAWVGSTVMVK